MIRSSIDLFIVIKRTPIFLLIASNHNINQMWNTTMFAIKRQPKEFQEEYESSEFEQEVESFAIEADGIEFA